VQDATGCGDRFDIELASDVRGGPVTVTVELSDPGGNLDLYVLEYTGLARSNAYDIGASQSGTQSAMASGSALTRDDNELIFGFGVAIGVDAGAGFTPRSTVADNVTEDMIGARAGPYQTTATMTNGACWEMIMATFRHQ
jgi:hypothetical protein